MASLGKVWNRTMHLKVEDYLCFSVLIIPEFEHELWLTTNGSYKGQATGCGAILAAVSKITQEKLHVGLTHERNIIFALSPWHVTKNAAASG